MYVAALRGAAGERGAIRGQTVDVFGRAAWRRPSRCEFENRVLAAGRYRRAMRPDQVRRSRRVKKESESISWASLMATSMGSQCGMPCFEAATATGERLPAKRSRSTRAGPGSGAGEASSRLQTMLRKGGWLGVSRCAALEDDPGGGLWSRALAEEKAVRGLSDNCVLGRSVPKTVRGLWEARLGCGGQGPGFGLGASALLQRRRSRSVRAWVTREGREGLLLARLRHGVRCREGRGGFSLRCTWQARMAIAAVVAQANTLVRNCPWADRLPDCFRCGLCRVQRQGVFGRTAQMWANLHSGSLRWPVW